MEKEKIVRNSLKKLYQKPTIMAIKGVTDDICIVRWSQQEPPKGGNNDQQQSDESQEVKGTNYMKPYSVWDN